MKTKKLFRVLYLLITLLLLPLSSAFAASIYSLGSNTALDDDLAIFRYRANPGIWQRSTSQQQVIIDAEKFEDSIYYITSNDTNNYQIISSANGLRFDSRFSSQQPITITKLEDALVGVTSDRVGLFSSTGQTVFNIPTHPYPNPEEYFAQTSLGTIFSVIANNRVDIYLLNSSTTSPRWSFNCTTAFQYLMPELLLQCDNTVWRYQNGTFIELLDNVTYLSGSEKLRLWQSTATDEFYLYDGVVTGIVFSDWQSGDALEVVSDRLFYRKSSGLFEVAWRLVAVEVALLPEPGVLRSTDDDKKVVLQTASKLYYSKSFNSWVETNLIGQYGLHSSSGGLIAYLPEGSGAFYENQPGVFTEMDSSWAASSKIKTFTEIPQGLLLVLRNSSNNPNVYRSTDYRSWQRITLPSGATHLVTISEARALPENTAVEVEGIITVLPGFAGDEVTYLEGDQAGIQLFLSKSKGEYSLTEFARVSAIGKISSSQVGRILLDAANTILVGSPAAVVDQEYTIAHAKIRRGQTALLRGTLSALATDSAILTDSSGAVKLHFAGIKTKFQNGDVILVRIVVDDNSATDEVEAWFAGGTSKLISAASTTIKEEDTVVAKTITAKSSKSTTVGSSPALPVVSISSAPSVHADGADSTTRVAGVQANSSLPDSLAFAAGLLAGALVIRGRRLQKYFPSVFPG